MAEEPARERECRASPNAAAEDDDVDEVVVQVPLKKRVARDAKRAGATATTAKAAAKAKAAATNADEDAAARAAPPAAAEEAERLRRKFPARRRRAFSGQSVIRLARRRCVCLAIWAAAACITRWSSTSYSTLGRLSWVHLQPVVWSRLTD